jgi:hypothetical protein
MALTIDELNIQIAAESTQATQALDALIGRLKTLRSGLNGLGGAGKDAGNGLKATASGAIKASTAIDKQGKSYDKAAQSGRSFTDNLAQQISKTRTLVGAFKSVANTMSEWFKESNDYIETVNLFRVTMGDAADGAREYAETVGTALGIDPKDFMQYQGVFKNLTAGFGVAAEDADIMSQNLTQLSYDMASFFNATTVEESFDKLSSAMSGQVKGLREYGIDTTVASLQEYALSKGIDTKVRAMTQAEKSLLRYNYIMEKSTHIQGDMARTIITPANALRVLSAQLTQFKRALGNIISVLVTQLIPYVQAAVQIFTEFANKIAVFFGFNASDFEADISGIGSSWGSAEEDVEDYTEAVKAAKKQLMGFDELNIISNPDSGAGAGAGAGGDALNGMKPLEYDFLKDLDTSKLDEIKEKTKKILQVIGLISIGIAAWNLVGFIYDLKDAIVKAGTLKAMLSGIGGKVLMTVGITLAIVGFALEFEGIADAVKEGLDGINFGKILGGGLLGTGGAAIFGATLATLIEGAFGSSAVALALTQAGINLGVGTYGAVGAALGGAVAAIVAGVPMYFVGIYDACKDGINWLSGALIALGSTLAGAGVGTIIGATVGSIGGPLGAGIGALIGLAVGLLTGFTIWLWQNFEKIENWFLGLPGIVQVGIVGVLGIVALAGATITGGFLLIPLAIAGVIAAIKTDFFGLIDWFKNHIVTPLSNAFKWWEDNVTNPIKESLKKVFDYAGEKYQEIKNGVINSVGPIVAKVVEIYNKIKEIFNALKWAFFEYVWNPMTAPVVKFYEDKIKPVVDKVKAAFTSIANWFKEKIYNQILKQVDTMKKRIEGFGTDVVDFIGGAFKAVMNNLFWAIEKLINGFIKALNSSIGLINKIPGVNITTVSELKIPRLAEGGIVNEGQMFIAREAGPELVGNIGKKTAVANNDQIISGIESGVYRAMIAANSAGGGTQTIRIINEIDGDVVGEKVIKYHNGKVMQTGVSPLMV